MYVYLDICGHVCFYAHEISCYDVLRAHGAQGGEIPNVQASAVLEGWRSNMDFALYRLLSSRMVSGLPNSADPLLNFDFVLTLLNSSVVAGCCSGSIFSVSWLQESVW